MPCLDPYIFDTFLFYVCNICDRASGSATWMLIDLLETGKPSILGIVNGMV